MLLNDFKINMSRIHQNPNAKESLTYEQFKSNFDKMNKGLDTVQKMLKTLLGKRRQIFSRFYFLSDEDMFEMLGGAKNPVLINKHLKKLFEGIKYLRLADKGQEKIIDRNNKISLFKSMVSPEEEEVDFISMVEISGNLIEMMLIIERQMVESLKESLKLVFDDFYAISNMKKENSAFEKFIQKDPRADHPYVHSDRLDHEAARKP